MPPLEFTQDRAWRHLGGALAGVERDALAGIADDGAGGGLSVAGANEGLEAGKRRLGRILAGELHLLADLVADAHGELLEGSLDRVGAIDALGDCGRQLLRFLLVGERLEKIAPARLLADFLDGEVDAVIDDPVHADASPLVADRGAIVDIGDADLQGPHGDGLNGRLEGRLVARLAGFVVSLGQGLRERRGDLSCGDGEGNEMDDQATYVSEQRGSVLRSAAAHAGGCT